ncbi:MAG: hypothetical protein ACF8XB_12645 [Planctomycetota bacterium JB042]
MTAPESRSSATSASVGPLDLGGIAFVGLLVRFAVAVVGRTTVEDGFYLRNAFAWSAGDTPYETFAHVAFPFVEAIYAPFLSVAERPLVAASAVTGVAVVATALLVAATIGRRAGRGAAWAGALLYLLSAPGLAFHAFEREVWSNLGLAAAVWWLFARRSVSDRRAALGGVLLALAATAKLTAGVGAAAIVVALARRREGRAALVATAFAGAALGAAALLLTARFGEEFPIQVFLFFFFKGAATDLAGRGFVLLQHVDPTLGLGLVGAVVALLRRDEAARPAVVLLGAWLAYYAFVSSSFWNHNALDLALPAALLGGPLLAGLVRRPRPAVVLAVVVTLFPSLGLVAPLRPTWFPHGFGGGQETAIEAEAGFLRDAAPAEAFVLAPSPAVGLAARRISFVGDYEVEPVVRALQAEVRRRGLEAAWKRRSTGALLGAPPGTPSPPPDTNLFRARIVQSVFLHVVPRTIDAVRAGEIAAALDPMPPPVAEAVKAAGGRGGAGGWRLDARER